MEDVAPFQTIIILVGIEYPPIRIFNDCFGNFKTPARFFDDALNVLCQNFLMEDIDKLLNYFQNTKQYVAKYFQTIKKHFPSTSIIRHVPHTFPFSKAQPESFSTATTRFRIHQIHPFFSSQFKKLSNNIQINQMISRQAKQFFAKFKLTQTFVCGSCAGSNHTYSTCYIRPTDLTRIPDQQDQSFSEFLYNFQPTPFPKVFQSKATLK